MIHYGRGRMVERVPSMYLKHRASVVAAEKVWYSSIHHLLFSHQALRPIDPQVTVRRAATRYPQHARSADDERLHQLQAPEERLRLSETDLLTMPAAAYRVCLRGT